MTHYYAYFKPENHYPLPVGTILRYAGHNYDHDTMQYGVVMDIIGEPVKDKFFPEITSVENNMHIKDDTPTQQSWAPSARQEET